MYEKVALQGLSSYVGVGLCLDKPSCDVSRGAMQFAVAISALMLHVTAGVDPTTSCEMMAGFNLGVALCDRGPRGVDDKVPRSTSLQSNALDRRLSAAECPTSQQTPCAGFQDVVQLDASNCGAGNISGDLLRGMFSLRCLLLRSNGLRSLPEDAFRENRFLVFVDVSLNLLGSLSPKLFDGLLRLEYLDLSNNRLRSVHRETFRSLHSLNTLLMNDNLITSLPQTVFHNLLNLRTLNLDNNFLTHLPLGQLQNLSSLVSFRASYNNVTSINPTFFSNLPNLKTVVLSHNSVRRLSKYTMQDLISISEVDFSFNAIEYLYLSRIPTTLVYGNEISELKTNIKICTNEVAAENPCFIEELSGDMKTNIFHNIDFSYNNITLVSYSKANVTHSLEFLGLALAGNFRLEIPVDFVKRERFITELHLDWTNFGWRNFTLINEIFELKNLKTLSIIGCDACEHYTRSLLFFIFNPKNSVSIVCNGESKDIDHRNRKLSGSSLPINANKTKATDLSESKNLPPYTENLYQSPCERIENSTKVNFYIDALGFDINLICNLTVDCSYSTVSVLPDVENASCIFFQQSGIDFIRENYFQYSASMRYVDLSYNSLNYLPSKIFHPLKNIFVLKLDYNMITYLQSSLFMKLSSLRFLSLKGNIISSYAPNAFVPLSSLQMLFVDFSNPANITDETFRNQRNLVLLEVNEADYNSRFSIYQNSSIFNNMSNLNALRLRGFTSKFGLGDMFCNVTGLQAVTLERTTLPVIPDDAFCKLTEIDILQLKNSQIKTIGENAFKKLAALRILDVSHNEINALHSNLFLNTLRLEKLNMSYNKIESFPVTLFHKLSVLIFLDMSHNFLTKIDWYSFAYLHSISGLNLRFNNISEGDDKCWRNEHALDNGSVASSTIFHDDKGALAESFVHSNQSLLKNATCWGNLNDYFWNKPNLTALDMANNSIVFISKGTFNSRHLYALFLSNNKIRAIDKDAFINNPLLKYLFLNNNFLTLVNENLFQNLTLLYLLDLAHNQIEVIEAGAFRDLKSLVILKLQFNRLKLFNAQLYFSENILTALFLHDNLITMNNTNFLPLESLTTITLHNNILPNIPENTFAFSHILGTLVLSNCSISTFDRGIFQNNTDLTILLLDANPVHSLTRRHFSFLQDLIYLDMSRPKVLSGGDAEYAGLSWKNMTLLNYFFELDNLEYIIIAGNPICELFQWTQIIENLFLSEIWRTVICTEGFTAPPWYVDSKKKILSINIDSVTRL